MESCLCSYNWGYIILYAYTEKSAFNVPDSQFTNQVRAKSQTTVAVLKVLA